MAVTFEWTEARVEIYELAIPVATFLALNTSYLFASQVLKTNWRVLDIDVIKDTVFDNGAVIKIGTGSGASDRELIATGAEVAATTAGTVSAEAWRAGANNLNDIMKAGVKSIYVRAETGLPTVGNLLLKIRYVQTPSV